MSQRSLLLRMVRQGRQLLRYAWTDTGPAPGHPKKRIWKGTPPDKGTRVQIISPGSSGRGKGGTGKLPPKAKPVPHTIYQVRQLAQALHQGVTTERIDALALAMMDMKAPQLAELKKDFGLKARGRVDLAKRITAQIKERVKDEKQEPVEKQPRKPKTPAEQSVQERPTLEKLVDVSGRYRDLERSWLQASQEADRLYQDYSIAGDEHTKKAWIHAFKGRDEFKEEKTLVRQQAMKMLEQLQTGSHGPEGFRKTLANLTDEAASKLWPVLRMKADYPFFTEVESTGELMESLDRIEHYQRLLDSQPEPDESPVDYAVRHLPALRPLHGRLHLAGDVDRQTKQELFTISLVGEDNLKAIISKGLKGCYLGTATVDRANNLGYLHSMTMGAYGHGNRTYAEGAAGVYSPGEQVAVSTRKGMGISGIHEVGHAFGDLFGHDNDPELREAHKRLFGKLDPHTQTGGPGHFLGVKELLANGFRSFFVQGEKRTRDHYDDAFVDYLKEKVLSHGATAID